MQKTNIEYLTHTWNPIAMLCDPVGEGCENCWHRAMAKRLAANSDIHIDLRRAYNGGSPILRQDQLEAPLRLRKPARIGVQFMGDLFHEKIDFAMIDEVGRIIGRCPQHKFVVLTKRPQRGLNYFKGIRHHIATNPPYEDLNIPNVEIGVSVSKPHDFWMLEYLLQIPAAVRFVSIEPMLGNIPNLKWYLKCCHCGGKGWRDDGTFAQVECPYCSEKRPQKIEWIIVGCESGARRRPCKLEWIKSVVKQCQEADVPCFVKQMEINGKVEHEMAKFPKSLQIRQFPNV